jgi:hypothetical protein
MVILGVLATIGALTLIAIAAVLRFEETALEGLKSL